MASRLNLVRIVSQIKAELDRVLDDESALGSGLGDDTGLIPRVDTALGDTKLLMMFEVPGTTPENLEVQITSRSVRVTGDKKTPSASRAGGRYLRVERQCGRFERSVELPSAVNPSQGRAVLEHGVLRIELPLVLDQRNKTYRLEVEAGEELE